ncbi:MAG: hypothetical protein RMJ56_01530 [Gemmataceae bacterium]|nr:hypothetical protein [Gemmata sp.]MDW8196263.1 hypothetical protein [Gemmataceae bacterium]
MLHRILGFVGGVVVGAFLLGDRCSVWAADPDFAGHWLLTISARPGVEQNPMILHIAMKDGQPVARVVATPTPGSALTVTDWVIDGSTVRFNFSGLRFEGTLRPDGNTIRGSLGNDTIAVRARLSRTPKTGLTAADAVVRVDIPAPLAEVQKRTDALTRLRMEVQQQKDADKRQELLAKLEEAQKEADAKIPGLLRDVVAQQADSEAALDAALDLLRNAARYSLTAAEATQCLALVEKQAAAYGPRYLRLQLLNSLEALVAVRDLAAVAEATAARLTQAPDAPAEYLARILQVRKTALTTLNKPDAVKAVVAELAKLEERIDAEYLKNVPPFRPAKYPGRKNPDANRVAVLELFTGAQCPPCVAADVAFDALLKSYSPRELVLIQYHLHIPGPDPLTNADTVARAKYYGIKSTPSTLFNGQPHARGGGGMAQAERKYNQYIEFIHPILEQKTEVTISAQARRRGDKIDITVEVGGIRGDDIKLRVVLVEETVKYVGGNQLRFHHNVVRAMPLGAEGVAITDQDFHKKLTVDLNDVRKNLMQYLDDYAANVRPFPKPDRPLEMKALQVIALVQNDATQEILQAVQVNVENKAAGGP